MSVLTAKSTFALFFGNRGFFPASLLAEARKEVSETLHGFGHKTIMLDASATRHGAVETLAEGKIYARFLEEHRGEFDGVVLCLPNFGDENGAYAALKDAGVPILVHAYPDDLDKMTPELRRDAYCGKLSVTDMFFQGDVKFTSPKPHCCAPGTDAFAAQIDYFDKVCRTVKSLKNLRVGSIGARVTPFKTVRIDEVTLQKHGITVESFDMSDIINRIHTMNTSESKYKNKFDVFKGYADFSCVPEQGFSNLVKLSVALDDVIKENELDAIALRCWLELQKQLSISPCVVLSELNDRGIVAACEVDLGNAVMMHALSSASGNLAACLDWNNNYGDDEDRCILFHCGPVANGLMVKRGKVISHSMLDHGEGVTCSHGCNTGRISPTPFTFGSLLTDAGKLKLYLGEGEFTADPIPDEYFGCAGVARIPGLEDVLQHVVKYGHRHHVSITPGLLMDPVKDALEVYMGCEVTVPQK